MPPADTKSFLTQQTLVPLGLLVAVVLTAVGGTWTLARVFADMESNQALRFQRLELKLDSLEQAVSSAHNDKWTRTDMRSWVDALQARNSSISVPDIK